jgi:hypothetical protein
MRITFTLLAIVLTITISKAQAIQAADVPAAVVNAVKQKFPNVSTIEWKLKDDEYRAEFKIDKRGHDVWLDKSGAIKKMKQDISKNDLPAAVKQRLEADFKTFAIDDADRIEKGGNTYYQVKLKSETGERKVLLTQDGKVEKDKEKVENQ